MRSQQKFLLLIGSVVGCLTFGRILFFSGQYYQLVREVGFDEKRADGISFRSDAHFRTQQDDEVLLKPVNLTLPPADGIWALNSEGWLTSPRYGNVDDGMDDAFVRQMILEMPLKRTLKNSICLPQSRFLNPTAHNTTTDIRFWAVRLVYLAFHYHQHHWAAPEARLRLENWTGFLSAAESNNVSNFDFECPDAKFMIVPLKSHGLGANMRTGIIPALLVGLVANRVVIFVNQAMEGSHINVRLPWSLASCDRHDSQCIFLPLSPCVLRHEDIVNAHEFDRVDFRRALKKSVLPEGFDDHKVWLFRKASGQTVQLPKLAVERLQQYSLHLIDSLPKDDSRLPVLHRAIEAIGEADAGRDHFNYAMATLKVHHALGFYALRPNLATAEKLQTILSDIAPADLEHDQTIGLPVRGSDKCRKESECLSFGEYMNATHEVWAKYQDPSVKNPNIVFTTEAQSVVKEQQAYVSHEQSLPFRFITNAHDITPDTGYLVNSNITADDAMLSSLSSFQAQLLARTTIGNCCSNFHHMLNDFLMEGCGAASTNSFMCLQESDNPMLRICCAWHRNCKRTPNSTVRAGN